MHHFDYRAGVLHADGVDLVELSAAVGTPFYCYSAATIERHYRVFARAFADVPALVCYAVKANSNQAVVRTILGTGFGLDCVSLGEVLFAMQLGAERILYTNNNVADDEFNAVVKLAQETRGERASGCPVQQDRQSVVAAANRDIGRISVSDNQVGLRVAVEVPRRQRIGVIPGGKSLLRGKARSRRACRRRV